MGLTKMLAYSDFFKMGYDDNDNPIYFPLDLVALYGPTGDYPVYSNLLDAFALKIKQHVSADNQAVIGIFGPTGSGKSTLGIQFCKALNKNWKLADNLLYAPNDLKKKLRDENADPINLFDEGSVTFNSLETTSKDGRKMSVLFDTMRTLHQISFIIMPDSGDLNKRIAKHLDFKVQCPRVAPIPGFTPRGFFTVSYPIRYDNGSVYWQKMGTGIYDKLSVRTKNEYDKLKREKQREILKDFIEGD